MKYTVHREEYGPFISTIVGILGAVGSFGYELVSWLYRGQGGFFTILDLTGLAAAYLRMPQLLNWVIEPQTWIGVHQIIGTIPCWLAFGLLAWLGMARQEAAHAVGEKRARALA